MSRSLVLFLSILFVALSVTTPRCAAAEDKPSKVPHVVFVTGDEEYRSEESMPMLARILKRDYGFRTTVCYSLDADGKIDPNNTDSITGLESLGDADLMVLFTRFRNLPADQMKHFVAYVDSGKPVVGFRTATHAFQFKGDSPYKDWNYKKIADLVGQHWITHHGHRGEKFLTAASFAEGKSDHPILRGVEPIKSFSWLYHVEGGKDKLRGDSEPLLIGKSLDSSHTKNPQYPPVCPVAWTKTYQGKNDTVGRVFFTTLGHPYDFKEASMRRLAINGILWSLGQEDQIPAGGAAAETVVPFNPRNAGFGMKFKRGVTPQQRDAGEK